MSIWQAVGAGLMALCIAAVLLALVRLPPSRISRTLVAFVASGALWAFGDVISESAPDLLMKHVGLAVLYTGAIYLPPLWWLLVLRWSAAREAKLPFDAERWSRVVFGWATAMWLLMITNPWHGGFITPVIGGRNHFELGWWVMALPNYGLILAAFCLLLWVVTHLPARAIRRQGVLMICASLVTLFGNWAYVFGPNRTVDATVMVLAVSGAILLVGMYREGLFGLLPVALPEIADRDPDGLLVVRPGGALAYANVRAREMFPALDPTSSTRVADSLAVELLSPDGEAVSDREDWEGLWWDDLMTPGGMLYRTGEDGERWVRMGAQIIRGHGGQIAAVCIRARDVTEEQTNETARRRSHRLESVADLAQGVAHDFRNVLAIIQGNADLLADEVGSNVRLQRQADRIREAVRQARELADQLQLYAGGIDPSRVPVDISEIVRQTVALREPRPGEASRVDVVLAADPLVVEADPIQLRQAVMNLWTNALEAARDHEVGIRVSTGRCLTDPAHLENLVLGAQESPGEYVWVRVADTGHGMSPETQERIFDPFFSTKGKQRGVGLSTVMGIARGHHALLELKTHPGRGSTFTLYLPVNRDSC